MTTQRGKIRYRKQLAFGCLAAVFSIDLSAMAVAQTIPKLGQPTAAAPGDIVVTANRREQRLQDVGIAVTALSAQSLKQLNIFNAIDLTRAVPTLKVNVFSTVGVVYNIRGVSQNDYGDQQEPPVAVYQDDSYSSSINFASFPTFDLARAEVLRGPQGTLFGRNATGGAIQFISQQPTKDFSGYATATTGSYGQLILEGALSGPLTDKLQVRISGIRNRDKGYIKNINPGLPARGANDHYALRGIIAWQPTTDIKATLTLRYVEATHERQAGLYAHTPSCPNAQFQGEFLSSNTTCAYWVGIGTPGPGTTATGYRNDAINPERGGNPYRTAETQDSFINRKIFGASLRTEATLGKIDLISITDYQHGTKHYVEGGDVSPDPGIYFFTGSKIDQASEELRASTKIGANHLTIGGYGLLIKGDYTGKFASPFYGYDPLATFSQRTRSFAFFGQNEWEVTPKLKLIGGVRYWQDTRRGNYFAAESSTGVSVTFNPQQVFYSSFGVAQLATGLTVTPASAEQTFDGLTARAEVTCKPVNSVLLYLSYNRGSKSGGFTFSTGTPFPGGEVSALNGTPYKPEVLDAYEAGVKSTPSPGTTLNLTVFYYNYNNYQAFAQYGAVQTIVNLPARSQGLEVEFNSRPLRGFNIQLSGSFLDTEVKTILLPDLVTVVKHNLPQAPGFSGTALARYEFAFIGGTTSLQVDAQYTSGFCFTALCAPVERERAYNVANARIGYAPGNDRWDIAFFVNNLFEERYRVYAFDNTLFVGAVAGIYAKPRTWGLTGTVHFGARS